MTVDLEPDFGLTSIQGTYTSVELIVPRLLSFFDDKKIKATFFVVADMLHDHADMIKEIQSRGHEIASHGLSHAQLNAVNSRWEITESKRRFAQYGITVEGFRATQFIIADGHHSILKEAGYTYDASLSRYFPGRYNNIDMENKPFLEGGLWNFPMSNFMWPAVDSGLSYLKLMYPFSMGFKAPYMFYLHPWEFLDKNSMPASVRRGFVKKLLSRNMGKKGWDIFVEYIEKSEKQGVQWVSCKGWLESNS